MSKELPANSTLSHYRIVSKIGAGGMGEVYLAQDTKLDRKVALKILPADLASNRDRMDRFVREAKSAAALSHPNIAQIFEIGEDQGTHYIAMEFIDGVTLREKIHRERTELGKLLRYLQHTAEGLAKAHAAGIVHRDLKPDNIMVTRDGHAKILDFGLAKLVEQQPLMPANDSSEVVTVVMPPHSTPGMVLGTVGYMSPEQAQGKIQEIDQRSDIFSFGCILFEAIAGRKAFQGKDVVDSLNKIIREPAPPVSEFNPAAPSDLQRIIRRCLAKDPDERYQTIKDVAIELKEVRRELKADGIDTPVGPHPDTRGSSDSGPTILQSGVSTGTPSVVSATRASSAEFIFSRIGKHKVVVILVLALIVAGTIAAAAYLHARNTEVAIESIAVLPFVNESNDPNIDWVSDGLTESTINSLTQLPNLKVIARGAVYRYKGKDIDPLKAGKELGARSVLTGRLQHRGDEVILSVELVDLRDNKQLWGDQYQRKMADLLSVQREIAAEITRNLRPRLSGEERNAMMVKGSTRNPEAYQLYLKGNYYASKYTREGLQKGIDYFNQAIAIDPNYALAHNGLAYYYIAANEFTLAPHEAMPRARDAATRALQIDESLADAHCSLGNVAGWYDWDRSKAEAEFKRAIELDSNNARNHQYYGWYLVTIDRFDEGLAECERGRALDPTSAEVNMFLGGALVLSRRTDQAIDQLRKTLDLDPTYWLARDFLGRAYEQKGDRAKAIEEFERARQLEDSIPENWTNLGHAYALDGKREAALKVLDHVKEMSARTYVPPYNVATVYAALGDKDQAFAWLERAYTERSVYLTWMKGDFQLDSLRADPRFADLVKRAGRPQ